MSNDEDLELQTEHIPVSLKRVAYVVSNELAKISSLLPSNKNRSLLVHTLVKQYGILNPSWSEKSVLRLISPKSATPEELSMYHSRDYVNFILKPSTEALELYGIEEDCPLFDGLPQYVGLVGGATLAAANTLLEDKADIAICWDGGRHHAQKSKASGFCYVADCVLAILALKRSRITTSESKRRKARIMYLDLDLHFSDGVSQAFSSSSSAAAEPQVLTFSSHHAAPGFFPVSELSALSDPDHEHFDPFTLSVPLARGASNASFTRIWHCVESVKAAFRPDYVVVQCGVDGLAGDTYGIWNWSLGPGAGSLGWCIQRVCDTWGSKVLLLGGGGYNHPNAARAWAYLTSIARGKPLPLDSDIPDHSAFPLYAPSFTLDVPAGTAQDQNTTSYLDDVQSRFSRISDMIAMKIPRDD